MTGSKKWQNIRRGSPKRQFEIQELLKAEMENLAKHEDNRSAHKSDVGEATGGQGEKTANGDSTMTDPTKTPCESCGTSVAGFESISLGSMEDGYKHLCTSCYNAVIAKHSGVEFEHLDFEPVRLSDVDGVWHQFEFSMRLLGDRVAIDAHEIKGEDLSGYRFQVIGFEPEGDMLELFGRLLTKMRRALSYRHLEQTKTGLSIGPQQIVRARIDCDLDNDDGLGERTPLLIIDGQEITWEHFGEMLMTFEGWGIKMEVFDPSDEP